ncbi:hypothetical protein GGER_44270 [Serratia rubidaea]
MKARLTLLSFCLLAAQASAGGNAVDNEGLQTLTSITQQNSDIPALLNYAERTPALPAPTSAPTAPAVKNGEASRLMKTLREQQAEMGRQEKTIAALRAELQALKQRPPVNDAALQEVEKLQQALKQQQAHWQQQKAAMTDAQQRFTQAEEALQGKERELQDSRQLLAKQHAELSTLTLQMNNGREQREAAERRAHDSAEKLAALQAEKQPPVLDSEPQQQAYAVGASLGAICSSCWPIGRRRAYRWIVNGCWRAFTTPSAVNIGWMKRRVIKPCMTAPSPSISISKKRRSRRWPQVNVIWPILKKGREVAA